LSLAADFAENAELYSTLLIPPQSC